MRARQAGLRRSRVRPSRRRSERVNETTPTTSLTAVRGTVVIMNLHYTGLGIARSLAGLPVDVIGVGADRTFFGGRSRHVRFLHSPDSALQPEACLRFLLDLAPSLRKPVVLLP